MHLYLPVDLDDMTAHDAVRAVMSDIKTHPVGAGRNGMITAARQLALLGHLTENLAGEAEHRLHDTKKSDTASQRARELARATVQVTSAAVLYAAGLHKLSQSPGPDQPTTTPGNSTAHQQVLQPDQRAQRVLDMLNEAHSELRGRPPATVPGPGAPASPARAADPAQETEELPKVTRAQYDALSHLAKGKEARLYRTWRGRRERTIVQLPDGINATVSARTFEVLAEHRLVSVDVTMPLLTGRTITVTPRGQAVLAQPRPAAPKPRRAAPAPPPKAPAPATAAKASGRR